MWHTLLEPTLSKPLTSQNFPSWGFQKHSRRKNKSLVIKNINYRCFHKFLADSWSKSFKLRLHSYIDISLEMDPYQFITCARYKHVYTITSYTKRCNFNRFDITGDYCHWTATLTHNIWLNHAPTPHPRQEVQCNHDFNEIYFCLVQVKINFH